MYKILRDCFAIAAVFALCVWSLAPMTLLAFGVCAVGFGIGALCMHLASNFADYAPPTVVMAAPPRTIFVNQQPTYSSSWSWSPFNWFSNWSWSTDGHYNHHTHHHAPASIINAPSHTVVSAPNPTPRTVHHTAHTHSPSLFSSTSHGPTNTVVPTHTVVSACDTHYSHGHSHSHSNGHC